MVRCFLVAFLTLSTPLLQSAPLPPMRSHDVVGFIGGAQMVGAAQSGYLEAALTARAVSPPPRFRDFSWEGDTVFSRPRPLNFPALTNLLARSEVTLAVLQFGQMESLAGPVAVPQFLTAYEHLLKSVRSAVPSVVILSPTPFSAAGPLSAAAVQTRNQDLEIYVSGLRELSNRLGVPFIDLSHAWSAASSEKDPVSPTLDGTQLTPAGQRRVAEMVVRAWTGDAKTDWAELEPLRGAVIAKNELWFRYWRPTNWAFLAGDRTEQPSSRDHRDRNIRWFPTEMEEYVPLIAAADAKIAEQIKESTR